MHLTYERYAPALLRKAERLVKSRDDAQDIVQGLFMDLLADQAVCKDLPYLYRAITNRCLNFLRDRKNRQRLLQGVVLAQTFLHSRPGEEWVMQTDFLLKLIERLDEPSREVLIYYYHDLMSQDEIATLLDTSRKTVGKRLQRVRLTALQLRSMHQGEPPCAKSA